jgi:hypothetical protein
VRTPFTETKPSIFMMVIVNQGAAAFITSAAGRHLPESDIWCILYPSLRHFLKSDVVKIDEQSLLSAMKPPVSHLPSLFNPN